ncbi:MAG: DciA family protein [Granulosicoccus sp.]
MKSFDALVGPSVRATMQENRQLKKVISQIVPGTTMAHILFCRIDAVSLKITVDNSAWIPRLRFSNGQIIDHLKEKRYQIELVSYHVAPAAMQQSRTYSRKPEAPSLGKISPLISLASELADHSNGEDDQLVQQLSRLANNLDP